MAVESRRNVRDRDQFNEYKDTINGVNDGTWHTTDTLNSVTYGSICYTVAKSDTYYTILDNTKNHTGGGCWKGASTLDAVITSAE